jgi:hypothetical protein
MGNLIDNELLSMASRWSRGIAVTSIGWKNLAIRTLKHLLKEIWFSSDRARPETSIAREPGS